MPLDFGKRCRMDGPIDRLAILLLRLRTRLARMAAYMLRCRLREVRWWPPMSL